MLLAARIDALAPTRRVALQRASIATTLLLGRSAGAATSVEADAVRVAQRQLRELLGDQDAFLFKVLVEGTYSTLPRQVPFVTFQKLERQTGSDEFMGAAVEYVEAFRDARDLVKLAVLGRSGPNGASPDVARGYYERALPALNEAAAKLDDVVALLPPGS